MMTIRSTHSDENNIRLVFFYFTFLLSACWLYANRDRLLIDIMKVMADNQLDVIVHKSVEHTPTLIKDGINPPFVSAKGVPTLNTYLIYAASMTVPAGFTAEGLPIGITFFGPEYSEPTLIRLAYAYEQATHHRIPPKTTPPLITAKSN